MLRCLEYFIYSAWADRIISGKGQEKTLPQALQNSHDIMITLCTTPQLHLHQVSYAWNSGTFLGKEKKKIKRDDDKSYKERDDMSSEKGGGPVAQA